MNRRPATTDELLAHADWVRRLSRALLSDPNEAEDVAQDAWVAALKRRPTAGDGMRAWWSRVVRSAASNQRRSALRRADREQQVASERVEATDPQVETTLDAHRRLAAAIDALDEALRDVIVEHYFHGSSSRQIAEREGVADSTIRTRLQKALEKLRRQLDEHSGGDRQAWALALAPLAKLDARALPAAAAAVVIAGWIKLAGGIALVGLAGAAAYGLLDGRRAPLEPTSSQPLVVQAGAETLSAPAVESRREPTPAADSAQAPALAAVPDESVARVEARVLDVHGLPIRGARLQCVDRIQLQECTPDEAPHGLADGTGLAACSVRAEDRSKRRASRAGLSVGSSFIPFEVSAPGHATRSLIAKVTLGQSTSLGDIALEDGGDLAGRCSTSDGTPLPGARVALIRPDLTLAERMQAQRGLFTRTERLRSVPCGADGSFSMPGAPAGQYRVCATSENLAAAISEPLLVGAGEECRVPDLVLGACQGTIRGIVLNPDGSPCAKAEVGFALNAAGDWGSTHCAADGTFVLAGSSLAEVDVCAHLTLGEVGERLLRGVRAGESGVVLQLPEPRRFEVHVQDPSGQPVSEFSLDLKHSDTPGNDTTFLGYRESPGDTLQLVASARPFVVHVEVDGYAAIEQGPFTQLDVPPHLTFRLQPSARLGGRVVLDGKPGRSLRVHLGSLRGEALARADGMPDRATDDSECDTSADGRFAIGVARGGSFVLSVQSRSGVVAFCRTIELVIGQPMEDMLIDLSATGAIAGRVAATPETRARAAQVMYSCGLQGTRYDRVAPDGTYRLDGLAPGTWWVRITPDVRPTSTLLPAGTQIEDPLLRRIEIVAGSVADCDFDLGGVPARRIDGRILFDGKAPTTWTASVSTASAAGDGYRTSASIRDDGSFEMPIATFGIQPLVLHSPGQVDRDDCITVGLEVATGARRWSLECQLGTLALEGKPGSEFQVSAELSGGATWTTHALLDAHGRATLDSLPAARARVSVAGSSDAPIVVEIPAQGRAQARLP